MTFEACMRNLTRDLSQLVEQIEVRATWPFVPVTYQKVAILRNESHNLSNIALKYLSYVTNHFARAVLATWDRHRKRVIICEGVIVGTEYLNSRR